jgi:ABC-type dipeptide/oligopeptide/nickel transport system permease component
MFYAQTQRSNWWGFIGKRVVFAVIAFFVISTFVFVAVTPRPVIIYINPDTTQETRDKIRDLIGYDSTLNNYIHWLNSFFTGNWGYSLVKTD